MRMMPSIFGEDLFDEWMDFPFEKEFFGRKNPLYGKNEKNLMKTDVKETDESFEVILLSYISINELLHLAREIIFSLVLSVI